MKDLIPQHVVELYADMKRRHGTTFINKRDSAEMQIVARFLDAIGVADQSAFLKSYATTIGHKIYLPFRIGDEHPILIQQAMVCAHEHQHVVVMEREGAPLYNATYVCSTPMRAIYEAECYRADMEVFWWYSRAVLGKAFLLSPHQLAAGLVAYGCSAQDVASAEASLGKAAGVIEKGGVSCKAAQQVIAFFGWGDTKNRCSLEVHGADKQKGVLKKVSLGRVVKKAPARKKGGRA